MSRPSRSREIRMMQVAPPVFGLLLFASMEIMPMKPTAALWAAPAILLAAMLIAWAAESAQYFIAQGFALAILAWLQTLPEFAVEAVLAWKQQVPLLLANLTAARQVVSVAAQPGSQMRMLDDSNAAEASRDADFWEKVAPTDLPAHGQIALGAYAIAQVDWSEA